MKFNTWIWYMFRIKIFSSAFSKWNNSEFTKTAVMNLVESTFDMVFIEEEGIGIWIGT